MPNLHFVHLCTRVLNPGDPRGPSTGQTLWGGPVTDGAAGVAWDWVQVQQGVVAMADPLALLTNLQLVGAEGKLLSGMEAAMRLNRIVHALPWQTEVTRALQRVEATGSLSH